MDEHAKLRMDAIELIAGDDGQYTRMLQEMHEIEQKYNAVLNELSTEQMDIVCDFVSQCEDMSQRMLELACIHMRFGN